MLRDELGGFRHWTPGGVSFDLSLLGMHPGVITARLVSLFRSEGKSPSEEGGSSEGRCIQEQMQLWLRCQRYILQVTARWMIFLIEGLSRISQLCRVSKGCPLIIFTRGDGSTNRAQERTWDSALNVINKHHSRLTATTRQYLISHLEFGFVLYPNRPLWRNR